MGLMDVLNGMQNGPHGSRYAPSGGGGGGMSPVTMAVLGVLAYKAIKSFNSQPSSAPAAPAASGAAQPGASSGGLGDLLRNGLSGVLGGGAAASVLSGGLGDLIKQFDKSGQGDVAKSWVDNGPNKSISPDDLAKALGPDQLNALTAHSGLSREDLLAAISKHLPEIVNELTPNGRLPTETEVSRSL